MYNSGNNKIVHIIVHILYILHTKRMFKHNDFHTDNIMISTKNKKQTINFNKNKYLIN